MTKKDLLKQLEDLKVPRVETPLHKEILKKTLLAAHQNKQSKPFIIPNLYFMKNFAPVSLLALVLVGGVLYGTNLLSSPIASAQSMIEKAITQVEHSNMSPDQQQKVLAVLKTAKDAKDLKFLGEKETAASGKVKALSFTDNAGKAVVVDLKENDLEKPASIEGQDDSNTLENEKTQTGSDSELNKSSDAIATGSTTSVTPKTESGTTESGDNTVGVKAPEVKTTETDGQTSLQTSKDAAEAVESSNDPAEAQQAN